MSLPEMNATVTRKVELSPGLAIFNISPINWELPDFTPGQYTVLGLPPKTKRHPYSYQEKKPEPEGRLIKRAYSITSGSQQKQYLEFFIKMVRSGALTPRLFTLNPGDMLWLSPKITGMFTLDAISDDRNIILFATGTGVAPYMSMLRSNMISHENRKYAVVHGAYNSWDLGYRDELQIIERLSPNLIYIPIISEPENEPVTWQGEAGFVSKIWEKKLIDENWGIEITSENTSIFLCGHPDMISGMVSLLTDGGFKEHKRKDPGNIHLEKYW